MDTNQTVVSNQVSQPSIETNNKKNTSKLVLVVVAVILLILAFIFAFTKFIGKSDTSTSGELVWWGLWEDELIVKQVINDYESQNPNIKIKYIKQSKEDYRERLINALAKGNGPDIFRFHNTWLPMFKSELDKVPSNIFTPVEYSNSFFPVTVSDLSIGSNIVGIPLEYDGLTLFVNEEIFDNSGKKIPATWNELRQVARELTVKDQNNTITQAGVALGRTENIDHWPEILGLMMLQNGVDLARPTGKLAEDALDFFTIFSNDDGVWDATLPSSTVAFASGNLAMYFGPSWRAFEIRNQNPNLRFKTVPLPQLPKTEANEPDVYYASYWVEGVWSKSKNKNQAWDFLKYLSSKDVLEKNYNQASKVRMFGEPYPRKDMSVLLSNHPVVGSIVNGAINSQTWYLQSKTWDGPTGINSQISKYFEDAVNAVNSGKESRVALEPVAQGVIQVLSQYGIKVQ